MKNRDNDQKKAGRKKFYTIEDIQRKLRFLHRDAVARLIRTGQIGSTKVGRLYRISQEHYGQFVEKNTFTPVYI